MALCPGLPRWAGTRKEVKPIWILLKQETVSGSGISWAICKSASRSRQITMPAPHHSVFYRPDALPAAQPTASKHWRQEPISDKNRSLRNTPQKKSLGLPHSDQYFFIYSFLFYYDTRKNNTFICLMPILVQQTRKPSLEVTPTTLATSLSQSCIFCWLLTYLQFNTQVCFSAMAFYFIFQSSVHFSIKQLHFKL